MAQDIYVLENSELTVKILSYGATIISIFHKGLQREMVLGFNDVQKYKTSDKYYGCTIGRVANRISEGHFRLNQQQYILPINSPPHHLHGGISGFDKKEFNCNKTGDTLICTYFSPHLEEGYPGNLQLTVTYTLIDNRLIIETFGESDQDTLMNVSNHPYFNLDADKKSIADHQLTISSDRIYPVDETGCTFNQPFDVKLTPFDFNIEKPIVECLNSDHPQIIHAKGLDHHFDIVGHGLRLAVTLSNNDLSLLVYTDKPGVHVYTGNYLNGEDIGFQNIPYDMHSGICFETQYVPNSINFDEEIAPILRALEVQRHQTIFEFIEKSVR
jgi:aldose 1-epimerase